MAKFKHWLKEKRFWLIAALFLMILLGTNLAAYHLGLSRGSSPAKFDQEYDLTVPESLGREWNLLSRCSSGCTRATSTRLI